MNTQKKETQELTDTSDGNPPSGTGDFSETKKQTKNIKQEGALLKKPRQLNQKKHQKKIKIPWILTVCLMTIILSFLFGILSQLVIGEIDAKNVFIAYILIILIVVVSIISDMIGVASTSCDPEPFLAMSARKLKGAKLAVKLAKNANIVSSICCDVIGDICGIISGACGAAIVAVMAIQHQTQYLIISVLCSTLIAAVMITGKALGKKLAIKNATKIILSLAKVLSVFSKK